MNQSMPSTLRYESCEQFAVRSPKAKVSHQAPVVYKMDNIIHLISQYLLDNKTGFPNTYPLDSDLYGG